MIKGFEPRIYQQTILATAVKYNTLVVLPTGMGKTNIFLMLAAQRLKQYPGSKILLIGPTRPLIEQYYQVFQKHFEIDQEKMAIFTGMVLPEIRQQLWEKCQVFFSTPQGLENDLIGNKISLQEVSLLGVDEAHRAVGDYSYVFIAKQYMVHARYPRILAMTASPGSEMEVIAEVVRNLHIEEIEVRTDEDPDVRPYIQEIDIKWVKVTLPPPFQEIQTHLTGFIRQRLQKLKSIGVLSHSDASISKKDLLGLQGQVHSKIASGEKDPVLWNAVSLLAEIMKVQHALELLETQGVKALYSYIDRLEKSAYTSNTKAVKNLVKDPDFRSAVIKARRLFEEKIEHPKLISLQDIVGSAIKENPNAKIIVFNQYRENAADIVERLNALEGVKSQLFIGQAKKRETGLTQKQQKEMLELFRNSAFNVLVATSVGEEGLDIPRVDIVIFFEPIPSAIRHIQRRGRTGRSEKGKVIILVTEGTRDVAYRWSAHHKEKKMYDNLKGLRSSLANVLHAKKEIPAEKADFGEEKVQIYADYREKASPVIKHLIDLGAVIQLDQLQASDYILGQRVGVEFKTVPDFVNSIIDGRIMDQVRELKRNFERPLIVIEGTEDLYSVRNVHPNAIRGMIANIVISYGMPLLYTKTHAETAAILYVIAKREQEGEKRNFMPHSMKRVQDTKWLQEYIVSALPGIGATLAKPLLAHFKSITRIVNASVDELKEVEGIGKKKAEEIRRILDIEYESKE